MKKGLLFLCLLLSYFSYGQTLRLAVYQYADNPRIKNLQPLADHIQQQLGMATTVKSYLTVYTFIEAIQKGEVDIAFINTFGYLLLETSTKSYPMAPKVALTVPHPEDNYKTAFVVKVTSPINRLQELPQYANKTRLGLVAAGSTSGNLVPRLSFTKLGIYNAEAKFQSVQYTGTHAKAIQSLLNNEVDLATMGNSEYTMLDSTTKQQLKLIELSMEIPLGPVLLHKKISASLQQQLIEVLLNIHQENPIALNAIKAAWSEAKQATHFELISLYHYDPFLQQFGKKETIAPILKQFAN